MKRNSFYLLAGIVALIEVGIFWLSVELEKPLLIQVAFVLGILLIYMARKRVEETIEDERTAMITQKAALRTLEVSWVAFFALSLGSAVVAFSRPLGLRPPHPLDPNATHLVMRLTEPDVLPFNLFGRFAVGQLVLLCLVIFLYVGFRVYYARKYGEWDRDEEQD
ncbi:DUF2178 domain-containing protein [Methanoculleus sp. Wushi-C6]|uniref:DUF2178 domain-containing protein n=1 Tax=Methanoculleus caldifontis TaxID=2651577 RepID=A0ABU3X3M9_9EURY|nr:DUF2178 domain-containing protein [Methanoculleus sp. Wushi-C6]MDV2482667.1 DUF2178 domain-containing protein [Methanoculleus sp. Wushi-C6]